MRPKQRSMNCLPSHQSVWNVGVRSAVDHNCFWVVSSVTVAVSAMSQGGLASWKYIPPDAMGSPDNSILMRRRLDVLPSWYCMSFWISSHFSYSGISFESDGKFLFLRKPIMVGSLGLRQMVLDEPLLDDAVAHHEWPLYEPSMLEAPLQCVPSPH